MRLGTVLKFPHRFTKKYIQTQIDTFIHDSFT